MTDFCTANGSCAAQWSMLSVGGYRILTRMKRLYRAPAVLIIPLNTTTVSGTVPHQEQTTYENLIICPLRKFLVHNHPDKRRYGASC